MATQAKNPSTAFTETIKITPQGRGALDRLAERMGWGIGRTASVAAVLAEQASDEQLITAHRTLNDAE